MTMKRVVNYIIINYTTFVLNLCNRNTLVFYSLLIDKLSSRIKISFGKVDLLSIVEVFTPGYSNTIVSVLS